MKKSRIKSIEVLGSNCPNCHELYNRAKEAVSELEMEVDVSHKNDVKRIIEIGLNSAPILLIDGQVVLEGKLVSVEDLKDIFLSFEEDENESSCHNCANCSCHD